MGITLLADVALEMEVCRECGGAYALSKGYKEQKRIKGGSWHCPYCDTSWHFSESENARLKKLLEKQEQQTWAEQQKAKDALKEARHFRRSRNAVKGQLTKVKNRIQKGICPHCNRYFKNLHRHMQSKHNAERTPQ
jgi:NMD protein affecting ribosome stability and mRNA decay